MTLNDFLLDLEERLQVDERKPAYADGVSDVLALIEDWINENKFKLEDEDGQEHTIVEVDN